MWFIIKSILNMVNHLEDMLRSYPLKVLPKTLNKFRKVRSVKSEYRLKTQPYVEFCSILSKYGSNHCQTKLKLISGSREIIAWSFASAYVFTFFTSSPN